MVASTLPPRVYSLKHSQSTCCSTHWTFFLHRFIRVLLFAQGHMYFLLKTNLQVQLLIINAREYWLLISCKIKMIIYPQNLDLEIGIKKKKWLNARERRIRVYVFYN